MADRDPREGEGHVFAVRPGPQPLDADTAEAYCDALSTLDNSDEMLKELESLPLAILRGLEQDGCAEQVVAGACDGHRLRLPADLPAIGADALRALSAIATIGHELRRPGGPRVGWILRAATSVGFRLAAMRARAYERDVALWNRTQQPLREQYRGEPLTDEARRLFDQGTAYRTVGEKCGVTRRVAERWRREWEAEKNS